MESSAPEKNDPIFPYLDDLNYFAQVNHVTDSSNLRGLSLKISSGLKTLSPDADVDADTLKTSRFTTIYSKLRDEFGYVKCIWLVIKFCFEVIPFHRSFARVEWYWFDQFTRLLKINCFSSIRNLSIVLVNTTEEVTKEVGSKDSYSQNCSFRRARRNSTKWRSKPNLMRKCCNIW